MFGATMRPRLVVRSEGRSYGLHITHLVLDGLARRPFLESLAFRFFAAQSLLF